MSKTFTNKEVFGDIKEIENERYTDRLNELYSVPKTPYGIAKSRLKRIGKFIAKEPSPFTFRSRRGQDARVKQYTRVAIRLGQKMNKIGKGWRAPIVRTIKKTKIR